MRLVSGVSCQEFGQVVNGQVIHTTLHWAKKVMVKMWDVDGLVDNQGERPPGLWVIIGNYTTHSLISFFFFFWFRGAGHSPQWRQVYYSLK
jgi:hypothetical protein